MVNENPDYNLPQGYKKFGIKDISFKFEGPKNTQLQESDIIAYDALDNILKKVLNVHILEPIPELIKNFQVRKV